MGAIIVFLLLLLGNIASFALPSLLSAWLLTLVLPVPFNQALWLSLGMIIVVQYMVQNITDIPGQTGSLILEILLSIIVTFILIAFSALFGWLLLLVVNIDLSIFEAMLLFSTSLVAGFFFLLRSGSVGLPRWVVFPDDIDEIVEDFGEDYVVMPPRKEGRRRKPGRRRWTN